MSAIWESEELLLAGETLPIRVYRPSFMPRPAALVLHLHGGTFACGDLDCSVAVCRIMAAAGAVVVSADYPLAPEHPFPAALNVSYAALDLLFRQRVKWAGRGARLFVAGEEAGANIATALTLMARDQHKPPVAGQVLLSPMLDPCLASKSVHQAQAGAVGCRWADGWQQYLGTPESAAHPYAAPIVSRRLGGLPPALILTSDECPLRDESLEYGRRLQACGVEVESHVASEVEDVIDASAEPPLDPHALPRWASDLIPLFANFLAGSPAAARSVQA